MNNMNHCKTIESKGSFPITMINNLTSSNPSSGGGNLTGINSKKSSGGENQKNKIEKIDENH